jgi:hypothetical protein
MKMSMILVLGLSVLSLGGVASAQVPPDMLHVLYSCHSAEGTTDSGYLVTIAIGGIGGLTIGQVARQTLAGPRILATFGVHNGSRANQTATTYRGNDFNLRISNRANPDSGDRWASFRAEVNGQVIDEPMVCHEPVYPL